MAIARDTTATFNASGNPSVTQAYTVTGSNPVLLLSFRNNTDSGDYVTGVTYGGQAMTQGQKYASFPGYFYYLFNPPTGSNNIVISLSGAPGSTNYVGKVSSYSGVNSTFDTTLFTVDTNCASNTHSLTPTASNCWAVVHELNVDANPSASTGATLNGTSANQAGVFDSNGTISAGVSYSMTITVSGGSRAGVWSEVVLAPFVAATATGSNLLMMGV